MEASPQGRWVRCVDHRGPKVRAFVEEYFADPARTVLLVAGAGFDPRSTAVAQLLHPVLASRLTGLLIREERPDPEPGLVTRAEAQLGVLLGLMPKARVQTVSVFDTDGTSAAARHVVAGRHVVGLVKEVHLDGVTDIIVDFSALSIGTSFPLTRALLEQLDRLDRVINLHATVTSSPTTDSRIDPQPSTFVGPVHGFQGRWGIDATAKAAKLWLPQLSV